MAPTSPRFIWRVVENGLTEIKKKGKIPFTNITFAFVKRYHRHKNRPKTNTGQRRQECKNFVIKSTQKGRFFYIQRQTRRPHVILNYKNIKKKKK